MSNRVYRSFTQEDLFSTTIHTESTVIVWSGSVADASPSYPVDSKGYGGNSDIGSGSISLYGGIRSRSDVGPGAAEVTGVSIYPVVNVDTYSIDKTIQVPDPYPHTGSIRFFRCTNIPQDPSAGLTSSDEIYFEEHHSVISRLSQWYYDNRKTTWPASSSFPSFFTGWHIPSMFYGRQIATGSVLMSVNAFVGSSNPTHRTSGTVYWVDDGLGRIWEVPTSSSSWTQATKQISGTVLYNEGIIAFTDPDLEWQNRLSLGRDTEPHMILQFRSNNPVKSMVFMCRMGPGEVNGSNNPSYYITDASTGERWANDWASTNEATTYISAIGLYNEERQLVGVAKLAQPIRKRERDAIDIRLRLDL